MDYKLLFQALFKFTVGIILIGVLVFLPAGTFYFGGVLLCGLGNEVNYLVNDDETTICNTMPFNPLQNEQQRKQLEQDDCGMQFSHTVEEQIGGQLEAGFMLTHIFGDTNGEGRLRDLNVECYLATRAVKR